MWTPGAQKSNVADLGDFPEDSVEKVHAFFERSFEVLSNVAQAEDYEALATEILANARQPRRVPVS
jgi:hypothetical protein